MIYRRKIQLCQQWQLTKLNFMTQETQPHSDPLKTRSLEIAATGKPRRENAPNCHARRRRKRRITRL